MKEHKREHNHEECGCGCGHEHHHKHEECGCGCGHEHHHEHEECGCGCGHEHHHEHEECGCGCEHEHHHEQEESGCVHEKHELRSKAEHRIYILENLGCANCAAKMEKKIKELPEVEDAVITFATKQLKVASDQQDNLLRFCSRSVRLWKQK